MKIDNKPIDRVCPICNMHYYTPAALSRLDNKTLICPDCGMRQALDEIGVSPLAQDKIIAIMNRGDKLNS